jgi:tRNA1(Val) A37 N6-methylase TrmN6
MAGLWKSIEHRHLKPQLRKLQPWRRASYGDIHVHYKKRLDGGGRTFGRDFIPLLDDRKMPKQARVFEWCAGPGFIGFSMLAYGLAETLCLADINPLAVEACRRTVLTNRLAGKVSVYQSDNLKSIPRSEQWDLVVSNPPHFDLDPSIIDLRSRDIGWQIHRDFFADVGQFLKPGGVIILQESNQGSTAETFRAMIEGAGLSIVFVHNCAPEPTRYERLYFIGIMRRGDARPPWVTARSP